MKKINFFILVVFVFVSFFCNTWFFLGTDVKIDEETIHFSDNIDILKFNVGDTLVFNKITTFGSSFAKLITYDLVKKYQGEQLSPDSIIVINNNKALLQKKIGVIVRQDKSHSF